MVGTIGFINLGPMEMMVVGIIAVLLFGKRLPEVGRSLGRGFSEFKKGMRGDEDEPTSYQSHRQIAYSTDHDSPRAPKFELPAPTQAPSEVGPASVDPSMQVTAD